MSLPPFREDGWLPEGHHATDWEEIARIFGGDAGSRRATVMSNLLAWRDAARAKGLAGLVVLDGSFISRKEEPGDFDLIFVYDAATESLLAADAEARALVDYANCKQRGGDVFIFAESAVRRFPSFCDTTMFDRDKRTQTPKGVVEVLL